MSDHIVAMVDAFRHEAPNPEMLQLVRGVASDQERWPESHDHFSAVRRQLLARQEDRAFSAQCTFAELCFKSLFNETDTDAPFDSDSSFWVVPAALHLAQVIGLDTDRIADAILGHK